MPRREAQSNLLCPGGKPNQICYAPEGSPIKFTMPELEAQSNVQEVEVLGYSGAWLRRFKRRYALSAPPIAGAGSPPHPSVRLPIYLA